MFTGIVQQTGRIERRTAEAGGARLWIRPSQSLGDLVVGESIAVLGVCLTVEPQSQPGLLQFFLSDETLARSSLGRLRGGELVGLERALRADDRLGGHLVMGHVDGLGEIRRMEPSGEGWRFEVAFPPELAPYLAVKGSVAVDGISLTIATLAGGTFGVALIPHTIESTHLREARVGQAVNLEVDVFARYMVRALETMAGGGGVSADLLARAGFTSRRG